MHLQKVTDYWMDVGRPWDLLKANEVLMSRIKGSVKGTVEPGATLKGEVVVEEGATVRSGSYIDGPVYISQGCDIGPNCYIRPSTSLGMGVKVGASVEVKNSIIMAKTHVPHHNYVGDSVIGERCNLGAGTKIANLRFDNMPVKVTVSGEVIDTGLRKLGVIMGGRREDRHQQHGRARHGHLGELPDRHGRGGQGQHRSELARVLIRGPRPAPVCRCGCLPCRIPASWYNRTAGR